MKQQHHPTDVKSFEKGINSDTNKELLSAKDGEHVDARNMRSVPMDGDNLAKKKIKGEQLLYPNVDNRCIGGTGQPLSDDYICMMTQNVNGNLVEAWAVSPLDDSKHPLIRINGKIVLMSQYFPIRSDYPLEYDKNETCIGGEIYITDNLNKPMVFNVKDLLVNSGITVGSDIGVCTQKYFDSFNLSEYVVGVSSSLFKIKFVNQLNLNTSSYDVVFGQEGLLVGMYAYSYRYVTSEGDRSGWSPITETIPVTRGKNVINRINNGPNPNVTGSLWDVNDYYIADNETHHPKAGHFGGYPSVASPTSYGNHIRLKYDNTNDFNFIEVRRDGWYLGSTLDTPAVSEIIGSFPIVSGLNIVDIFDYASDTETEEVLTEEAIVDVPESIQRAKAIRYYNRKLWLMNVGYREKDIDDDVEFITDQGDVLEPTIQKMFKSGHTDVYNGANYKSNMRGEAYGFGIVVYDDAGSRSFAKSISDSFQFPNRRDPVPSSVLEHSYFGAVTAADTNGVAPNYTYEVFDHKDANDRVVIGGGSTNVHEGGEFAPQDQFGNLNSVANSQYPLLLNIYKEDSGTQFDLTTKEYSPLHPTSQTDNLSDYSRRINTHVYKRTGINETPITYNPKCFGLDYYSLGASFKGVKDDKLPSWADGFSVVQTDPANRVVAQGMGFYSIYPASGGLTENGGKDVDALLCNFPDFDATTGINPGMVSTLLGQHGATSPYRLELVSPLGFFSEFYSFYSKPGITNLDGLRRAIDGIAYCRILKDSGEINTYEWDGIASLNDYVGFGGWRELSENQSSFPGYSNLQNGNPNYFVIDEISEAPTTNGTGSSLKIKVDSSKPIYSEASGGQGTENQNFDHPDLKKWHEPMYVVNIVRTAAQINPGILTEYNHTGHYVKLKSKILESDGSNVQEAVLISERWEDCTQRMSNQWWSSNPISSLERFVWVKDLLGNENRWLDVSNKTPGEVGTIEADISANGFHTITDSSGSYNVYGVYTVNQTLEGTGTKFTLIFEDLPTDSIVYVKYDNRIPVRVFGGDTWVNEHIFPVLDNKYDRKGNEESTADEFKFNVPFPFPQYAINAYIGIPGKANTSFNWLVPGFTNSRYLSRTLVKEPVTGVLKGNTNSTLKPSLIYFDSGFFGTGGNWNYRPSRWRQLVAMWTAESKINLSYSFNMEADNSVREGQFLPLKNYIYRPGAWKDADSDVLPPDNNNFFDKNNIYDNYYTDYGREHDNWGLGGFRFSPSTNIDYSKKQITEIITSTPTVGFQEEVDFCTRIIWSVTRPVNIQNSPTVKTFPPGNYYDIDDSTGSIKFAWDADSDKGNNLYALTNNGVCLVLVDKRVLSEINANELATVGSEVGGVTSEIWIDKTIGMDNETWRSWAEYSNTLFWTNSVSSYAMSGNQIKDIAQTGYSSLLRTEFIPKANKGLASRLAGVYDVLHKEYWTTADTGKFDADNKRVFSTLIFGVSQDMLQCQSDYNYDKYLSVDNKVYGMKGLKTYELGVGNLIDDGNYDCYVSGVSDADLYSDKEFLRIRVNSNSKPKKVEFFDDYEQYKTGVPSSVVDANANPINIKDYYGYECYIPRKAVAPYNRQQGRKVIFRIISDDDENFFISTAGVQYKTLK